MAKRGNQNPYIEGKKQTTQWQKEVIRIVYRGKKQTTQWPKEVIRICISRKKTDNTMAKRKRINNDLQNIHIIVKIE
jgi:hypothetical protein